MLDCEWPLKVLAMEMVGVNQEESLEKVRKYVGSIGDWKRQNKEVTGMTHGGWVVWWLLETLKLRKEESSKVAGFWRKRATERIGGIGEEEMKEKKEIEIKKKNAHDLNRYSQINTIRHVRLSGG